MKTKIFVFTLFTVLSLIVTWPLVLHLDNLIIDPHDGLLNTWMLNWIVHSFSSGPGGLLNFYHANIFFPYRYTFAFSDLQLPIGLISLPFVKLFGEPLIANNAVVIIGLILTGFSSYLLVQHLTDDEKISVLAGVVFTFSTIHLNYISHQQAFQFWPVLLFIYSLLSRKPYWQIFFFLIASLTYIANFYNLIFIAGLYLVFFRKNWRRVAMNSVISVVAAVPFLIPYLLISQEFHYTRPITDAIHFSLHPLDLFNISTYNRLGFLPYHPTNSTPAFFGIVIFGSLAAMLARLVFAKKKFRKIKKGTFFWFFVFLAVFSFMMALGPGLHIFRKTIHVGPIPIIPLPYLVFYYLVPGFKAFRTPSRWILITGFAIVIAAAIYFAKRVNWRWVVILGFLAVIEIDFPFRYYRVPTTKEFPPEQIWLKDNYQGAPIIQFPIYNWNDPSPMPDTNKILTSTTGVGQETLREYYSTIHWHPMFNGYSGFSPKEWEQKVKWLQKVFPSNESISYLRGLKIKLILAPSNWNEKIASFSAVKIVQEFPQTNVYEIL